MQSAAQFLADNTPEHHSDEPRFTWTYDEDRHQFDLTLETTGRKYIRYGEYEPMSKHFTRHKIPADELIPQEIDADDDMYGDYFNAYDMPYCLSYAAELKEKAAAEKKAEEEAARLKAVAAIRAREDRERAEFERLKSKFGE